VLYLPRFITRDKADYYRHLQAVRDTGDWAASVIYMLEAVAETSATTVARARVTTSSMRRW